MTTVIFITEFQFLADEKLKEVKKYSRSKLYPDEVVTLALLFALKRTTYTNFCRYLKGGFLSLFLNLPERS